MAHVIVGIQARLGSNRLPRKTALPFLQYNSLLEAVVSKWKTISDYPVYTLAPDDERDDVFWQKFKQKNDVFFGNPHNLIKRYHDFAEAMSSDTIVRITGDNPHVHKDILALTLKYHFETGADYTSSKRDDGAAIPYGLGVEVFQKKALSKLIFTKDLAYQEHVSEAFIKNEKINSQIILDPLGGRASEFKNYSFTIDEYYQYDFWNKII